MKNLCFIAIMFCGCIAAAHDHWITAQPVRKAEHLAAEITVGSGHSFPKSDMLPAERFLTGIQAVRPDGKITPLQATASGHAWKAEVELDQAGVWLFDFAMQRPRQPEPIFLGRAILTTEQGDDHERYSFKKGLEILPGAPISGLKPGDILPLSIMRDGVLREGRIAVTPELGSVSFLSAAKNRPAMLKVNHAGRYLLTASHDGQTFSLTFAVSEGEGAGQ